MKFQLTIYPDIEVGVGCWKTFQFKTKSEMIAAKNCAADFLLLIQDKDIMKDFSSSFVCEELISGEWEEFDEGSAEEIIKWSNGTVECEIVGGTEERLIDFIEFREGKPNRPVPVLKDGETLEYYTLTGKIIIIKKK